MGKRGSLRPGFLSTAALVLVALLGQACSDNKGPAGPTFGTGQTGHADTPGQIVVQVAINANSIQLDRRAGITVLVTNLNGRALAGKKVQMSTTVGSLDIVDGVTDAQGKFVTTLKISSSDVAPGASGQAVVTAFVEGASGSAVVTVGSSLAFAVLPGSASLNPGQSQTFQASGGTEPYTWTASGGTLNTTAGPTVTFTAGQTPGTFTLTVRDGTGKVVAVTIAITTPALTVQPSSTDRSFGATGGTATTPGTCASIGTITVTLTITGGSAPYTLSTTAGTVSPSALGAPGNVTYSVTPGTLSQGTTVTQTITVLDAAGGLVTATVTIRCTAPVTGTGT